MGSYTSDQTKLGWLTSILELGAWFGTLYSGFLAEILSRKYAILINVAVFIIGVVVQTTAVTSAGHSSILGGRFITGEMPVQFAYSPLTKSTRYGRWVALDDSSHVQCGNCASRSTWRTCRSTAAIYHSWYSCFVLDRLRHCLYFLSLRIAELIRP
jgi:hypothetical protein